MQTDTPQATPPKDLIDSVTSLTHLLLRRVRSAINTTAISDEEMQQAVLAQYERLFGPKYSLASVLSEIADIALKIEKQRPSVPSHSASAPIIEDKDVSLIKQYMQRQRRHP